MVQWSIICEERKKRKFERGLKENSKLLRKRISDIREEKVIKEKKIRKLKKGSRNYKYKNL